LKLNIRLNHIWMALAVVLCLTSWGRFAGSLLVNTPPLNQFSLVEPDGTIRPSPRFICSGAMFQDGDTLYRWPCYYRPQSADPKDALSMAMGRLNLATGRAEMVWPLTDSLGTYPLAFVKAADGRIAIIMNALKREFYVLRPDGSFDKLPAPPVSGSVETHLAGLLWLGDTLRVVGDRNGQTVMEDYGPNGKWQASDVPPRPECEGSQCVLQLAYLDNGTLNYWYSRVPRTAPPNATTVTLELLIGVGEAKPALAQSMRLSLLRKDESGHTTGQYLIRKDGTVGIFDPLDLSRGNIFNMRLSYIPIVSQDGSWTNLPNPPDDSFEKLQGVLYPTVLALEQHYRIRGESLEWMPSYSADSLNYHTDTQAVYLDKRWYALASNKAGIFVRNIGGEAGPVLMDKRFYPSVTNAHSSALLPADGGYWLYTDSYGYMKLDEHFRRADAPGLLERIGRLFGDFRRYSQGLGDSDFFRSDAALKQATVPLLLLGLPVTYGVIGLRRRARKPERSWPEAVRNISLVYILLFALTAQTFWMATLPL
jgi:hypothetical protein